MALTTDKINNRTIRVNPNPATHGFLISPSNTNYVAGTGDSLEYTRGLMCTVAGNANLVFADMLESEAVLVPMLAGVLYPFAVKMIKTTNTTATGFIGFR